MKLYCSILNMCACRYQVVLYASQLVTSIYSTGFISTLGWMHVLLLWDNLIGSTHDGRVTEGKGRVLTNRERETDRHQTCTKLTDVQLCTDATINSTTHWIAPVCMHPWELGKKRSRLVTVRSPSYGLDQPLQRSEVTGSGVELSKPITGRHGAEGLYVK